MRFSRLALLASLLVLLAVVLPAPASAQQDGIFPTPRTLPLRPDFNPLTVSVSLFLGNEPSNQPFRVYFVDEAQLPQINRRPDDYRNAEIPTPSWITLSAGGGVTPAQITFTADFNQFADGQARTALCVFQEDTFLTHEVFTKEVRVDAQNVVYGGGQPRIDPSVISFEDTSGGQEQHTETLTVSALEAGQFSYQFEIPQDAQDWLTINPPFAAYSGQPIQHTLTATLRELPRGTHSALLRMTHDGQGPTLTIPITATLLGTPVMTVTPTAIETLARQFKENPPDNLEVCVENTGGGVIDYQLSVDYGGGPSGWLGFDSSGGQAQGDSPTCHPIRWDALELPVGTHDATITVTANGSTVEGGFQQIPVELDVFPGGTAETAPKDGFFFTAAPGSTEPLPGLISLTSPELDDLEWTASVQPSTAGWLRLLTTSGRTPGALRFEIDPAGVGGVGQFRADVAIHLGQAETAAVSEENPEGAFELELRVPVTLAAQPKDPALTVAPAAVELIARESSPGARVQPLRISAGGGAPELQWTASARTVSGGEWLSLSATAGVTPAAPEVRAVTDGLAAGVYRGEIEVAAGGETQAVQVALLVVESGRALLSVGQAGVSIQGTGAAQTREVRVVNLGDGEAGWTATVKEKTGGNINWADAVRFDADRLHVVSSGTAVGLGVQRGLIEVASPETDNSPQYLTLTYEKQDALTAEPQFQFAPGGLVFTAAAGETSPEQTLDVSGTFAGQTRLQFSTATDDAADWLTARTFNQLGDPIEEGSNVLLRRNAPVELTVTADASGLTPGVYRGRVVAGVAEERSGSVPVTFIVRGPSCQPDRLVLTVEQPADDFRGVVGRPVGVRVDLRDDCGAPVASGGVTAYGAGSSTALLAVGGGRFEGAWVPAEASPERQPTALRLSATGLAASGGGLVPAEAFAVGRIAENSEDWVAATPPVHGATFLLGQPLAPGSIASVFGQGLAGEDASAEVTPLPVDLQGLEILVGGAPAALYFASPGQANLQIPSEAPVETRLQAVIRTPAGYGLPQSFFTAPAQPGLFPVEGRAIALNQDGSLNSPSNPARIGEVLVIYFTGQGLTRPTMPASGMPAPAAEPLARVAHEAAVRLGGVEAQIAFLGLTPGFVGLTQGNIILPEDAPVGDEVALEVEIGGHAGPPLPVSIVR